MDVTGEYLPEMARRLAAKVKSMGMRMAGRKLNLKVKEKSWGKKGSASITSETWKTVCMHPRPFRYFDSMLSAHLVPGNSQLR